MTGKNINLSYLTCPIWWVISRIGDKWLMLVLCVIIVSTKDILTLTRQYNGRTDGDLTYTIVAGSKTITGTMPGVRDKRETTIDLNKELQGVEASELKVTITNARGIKVVESTVPLVIPD